MSSANPDGRVLRRYVVQVRYLHNSAWQVASSFRRRDPALDASETWIEAGAYDSRVIDTKYQLGRQMIGAG